MKWLRALLPLAVAAVMSACATTDEPSRLGGGMDRTSPVRTAEVNTRLGIGYMGRGQYQLALEKLTRAVEQDPEHTPAHNMLGMLYEQLGDTRRAEQHYQRAARLAPNDGATQNTYGAYLCRNGQLEEAERRFLRATEDPFYATPEIAWTNAGACARRMPDNDRAEQYFRRALQIRPDFTEALYHMADLSYQHGDALRARAFIQRLESVARHDPETLYLGYRIELALGNPGSALDYAEQLRTRFPDSDQAVALRHEANK